MAPYRRIYRWPDLGVRPVRHSDPASLPTISDFPLFISGNPTNVRLRKCQPGLLSPDALEKSPRTALRIMRFFGNKPFVCGLDQLPYLFPLELDVALLNSLREPYWAHDGHPRLGSPSVSRVVVSMAASALVPIATNNTEEIATFLPASPVYMSLRNPS